MARPALLDAGMITQPLSAECDDSHSGGGKRQFRVDTARARCDVRRRPPRRAFQASRSRIIVVDIVDDAEGFDHLIVL
jgi:hypothetical protein